MRTVWTLVLALGLCLVAAGADAQNFVQSENGGIGLPESIDDLLEEVEQAREEVDKVVGQGGDATQQKEVLKRRETAVEYARVRALSEQSGLPESQIRAMRASGKGWGEIAGETGVHPSALGLGKEGAPGRGKGVTDGAVKGMPEKGKPQMKKPQTEKPGAGVFEKGKPQKGGPAGGKPQMDKQKGRPGAGASQ